MDLINISVKNIKFGQNYVGLTDELKAMLISKVFLEYNKNILVLTESLDKSDVFNQMLNNYCNNSYFYPVDDSIILDVITESPELKMKRLNTLKKAIESTPKIISVNLTGFLKKTLNLENYSNNSIRLTIGQDLSIKSISTSLTENGYVKEEFVEKSGQYSLRGYVLDVFPINSDSPIRIEFWGDTIESIRTFDIDSQRTLTKLSEAEIITNEEKSNELFSNIIDYLEDPIVIIINYETIERKLAELVEKNFDNYSLNAKQNYDFSAIDKMFKKQQNILFLSDFDTELDVAHNNLNFSSQKILPIDIEMIKKDPADYQNSTLVFCFDDMNKAVFESAKFKNAKICKTESDIEVKKINFIVKSLVDSYVFQNVYVISESDYYGKKIKTTHYKTNTKMGNVIKNIGKIIVGDYVVHNSHGIGKYVGIKKITKSGIEKEYLQINYKGNDKIYLPVEKIDTIVKYSSTEDVAPKLNSLSGTEWAKTKAIARKRAENIASELLQIYTKRSILKGFEFPKDDENQISFENDFPFVETEDQLRVVREIKDDMESDRIMNRLLCGDVGFGKTEVAFRAMFKAIMGGKQVMLLCPTTLLSRQHYENAIERFKSFPINIGLLNRFVSGKLEENTIKRCKNGGLDIVIGTHRLLSKDVGFKDLGLLVIDEEQRFGVKHKEIINSIKENVDVLTLSATPIPRTIQLSMAGIRSLSLIETPPVDRHPIQTYVLAENDNIIKDAIEKELARDGQVFVLYNNIEKMTAKQSELKRLVPNSKIAMAHGRMGKTQIEDIMNKFLDKEFNILLCTTIIETGIDIPSVNTLIILDADNYGLSQLYQIRGRVGRSDKIAFSYLMYNKHKLLNDLAIKRLEAIKNFTELGSGFSIAMRDLSIRGAGDLLGKEQSGFIDSVGMTMFINMLSNEVKKLQGIDVDEEEDDTPPLLNVKTSIDEKYVDDQEVKIDIHKKINMIDSVEKLIEVKNELEDRYGKIGEDIIIYMYEELFDRLAKKHHITNIRQTENTIEITLNKEMTNSIDGSILFTGLNDISRMFRVALKFNRLVINLDTVKLEKHFVYYLIEMLYIIEKATK